MRSTRRNKPLANSAAFADQWANWLIGGRAGKRPALRVRLVPLRSMLGGPRSAPRRGQRTHSCYAMVALLCAAIGASLLCASCESRSDGRAVAAARIRSQSSFDVGDPVIVDFSLENASEVPLCFLVWHTPLEGIQNLIFSVRYRGKPVRYIGSLAMRGEPTTDSYVCLGPGEAVTGKVDLRDGYDLSRPGPYQVQFYASIWYTDRKESELPLPSHKHERMYLESNVIEIEIKERSQPASAECTTPTRSAHEAVGDPGKS